MTTTETTIAIPTETVVAALVRAAGLTMRDTRPVTAGKLAMAAVVALRGQGRVELSEVEELASAPCWRVITAHGIWQSEVDLADAAIAAFDARRMGHQCIEISHDD